MQVDCSVRLPTPMGRAVRWRLLKAQSGRRLTVRPMESEQPGAESNHFQEYQYLRKYFLKACKKPPVSLQEVFMSILLLLTSLGYAAYLRHSRGEALRSKRSAALEVQILTASSKGGSSEERRGRLLLADHP